MPWALEWTKCLSWFKVSPLFQWSCLVDKLDSLRLSFSSLSFIRKYFIEACDVPEPEEKFNMDKYTDMVTVSKPVIYISIEEIINTHSVSRTGEDLGSRPVGKVWGLPGSLWAHSWELLLWSWSNSCILDLLLALHWKITLWKTQGSVNLSWPHAKQTVYYLYGPIYSLTFKVLLPPTGYVYFLQDPFYKVRFWMYWSYNFVPKPSPPSASLSLPLLRIALVSWQFSLCPQVLTKRGNKQDVQDYHHH